MCILVGLNLVCIIDAKQISTVGVEMLDITPPTGTCLLKLLDQLRAKIRFRHFNAVLHFDLLWLTLFSVASQGNMLKNCRFGKVDSYFAEI